nr:hypothetical protein [Tanacetum cinerariifolium]
MNLRTLPKSFWGYALETAARILNMVATKKVDRTPYEIWHEKAPNLSYLRVWGCEALVKQDTPDKLNSRSIKCIFVGYPKEMTGYYFYYLLENKIFVSRNSKFFEKSFVVQEASRSHGLLEMSGSDKGLEIIQEEDTQPYENTSKEHTEIAPTEVKSQKVRFHIRRSARIPQALDGYGYYADVEEDELGDFDEPPNYKAALADPESDKWLKAMNTKMQSMKDNHKLNLGFVKCFSIKDLGEETYILGIKIIRDRSKRLIALSQSAYLEKILKKFRMENSKKGYTPMMEKPDYRKSQGAKTPTETGYVFVRNGGAVDWKSSKQSTTAMSFIEVEYIVTVEASMEAVWMRKFIDGLGEIGLSFQVVSKSWKLEKVIRVIV